MLYSINTCKVLIKEKVLSQVTLLNFDKNMESTICFVSNVFLACAYWKILVKDKNRFAKLNKNNLSIFKETAYW